MLFFRPSNGDRTAEDREAKRRAAGAVSRRGAVRVWALLLLMVFVGLSVAAVLLVSGRDPRDRVTPSGTDATRTPPRDSEPRPASLVAHKPSRRLAGILARRHPAADDWNTEVLWKSANDQLKELAKRFGHGFGVDSQSLTDMASDEFACGALRPPQLVTIFDDGDLSVTRARPSDGRPANDPAAHTGLSGLVHAMRQMLEPMAESGDVHMKFKIVQVERSDDKVKTQAYFLADGRGPSGIVQQNAVWDIAWDTSRSDRPLRIRAIRVSAFEEVTRRAAASPLLVDCTGAVLGANPSFRQQLMKGTNTWRARLQQTLGVDVLGHQGMALGDVNGDALEDLYICQPGGVPNRLYVQRPDGTAVDRSAEAGVDILDRSRSALWVDLDNDGDQDLVIATDASLLVMANDGTAMFSDAAVVETGTSTSLSAADYDADGDLDLYVCGYSAPTGAENAPVPYHDANNGHRNHLLRNDGEWKFVDVTAATGMDEHNRRYSFAASWDDFDNDGDLDLYVANDFGRNNLYRNDSGRFRDIAAEAGVEDISAGMGVSWGDFNRDGWMDIYVSNMFSSAGNRVAYQRRFRPRDDDSTRRMFQRHARGNTLFENTGNGTFRDVSEPAKVTMGRWAWGSLFADINNDGLEDILVTNGLATNEDTDDL